MNETDLMSQGFTLLLLGMGTVFVFLTVLVLVTSAMSYLVQKWFPEPIVISSANSAISTGIDNKKLVAVISAAIHQHRKSRENRLNKK